MADTVRTLAALQGLMADGIGISAQDLRDMLVSVYPTPAAFLEAERFNNANYIDSITSTIGEGEREEILTETVTVEEGDLLLFYARATIRRGTSHTSYAGSIIIEDKTNAVDLRNWRFHTHSGLAVRDAALTFLLDTGPGTYTFALDISQEGSGGANDLTVSNALFDVAIIKGGGSSVPPVSGKATRELTKQSIADNAITAIEWDTEVWDTANMVDVGGTNPERIVITQPGKYRINGNCYWDFVASSYDRELRITKNGTTVLAVANTVGSDAFSNALSASVEDEAVAGDYYEIEIRWWDTGSSGNRDIQAVKANNVSVTRIGNTPPDFEDWTDYTPAWTANTTDPTIGNGTIEGRYRRTGNSVRVQIQIEMGSTTTFGSGTWQIGLPSALGVVPASTFPRWVGAAYLLNDGTAWAVGVSEIHTGNDYVTVITEGGTARVDSTNPFTWAQNDLLAVELEYETDFS